MENIEKIEVIKGNQNFFYTGTITFQECADGWWAEINTTRGERYKFRKEQIVQRLLNPEKTQKEIEEFRETQKKG